MSKNVGYCWENVGICQKSVGICGANVGHYRKKLTKVKIFFTQKERQHNSTYQIYLQIFPDFSDVIKMSNWMDMN